MSSEALLIFCIAFAWMSHTVWQHKGDTRQHRDDKLRQEREQTRNNCQTDVRQTHAIDCKSDNLFRKLKDIMNTSKKSRLGLPSNLLIGRWTGQNRRVVNTTKTIALYAIDTPAKCLNDAENTRENCFITSRQLWIAGNRYTAEQQAEYYKFNSTSRRVYDGNVPKRLVILAGNDDCWRCVA